MNTRWFALGTVLTLLILMQSSASAYDWYYCDISVRINEDNAIHSGRVNKLEIWIMNTVPLAGMVLSFRTDWRFQYHWIEPYGNLPESQPRVRAYGDAVGAFELSFSFLDRNDNVSPDTMCFTGMGITHQLPAHFLSTKLYETAFYVDPWPHGGGGMMCIDNIASDTFGIEWAVVSLSDLYGVAPTFQRHPNTDCWTADAPAVCYYPPACCNMRGDVNLSGSINITDVVYLTRYVYGGGPEPKPFKDNGDINCDQTVNLADIVYLLAWLFTGGPPPC
jgi:hypothetical protein